MAKAKRNPSALTGIAGVHYVVSEFSQRGMIALPTIRNTAGYDIIVVSPDGRKHANIQVKTSSKKVNFWPMPPSDKIRTGPRDYYVFLRWLPKNDRFQGFMVRGREAKREVRSNELRQERGIRRKSRHKLFPALHVGGWRESKSARKSRERKARRWEKIWESWEL